MAKASLIMIAIAVLVTCLSSLASAAEPPHYTVQGQVYCDTCRVGFQTRLSEAIEGAVARLTCRNRTTGEVTLSEPGQTDESGYYNIHVDSNHEEEICEVTLDSSEREDCNEVLPDWYKARILLANNSISGVTDNYRYPNTLGFMIKKALPGCAQVLAELGFLPLN
ncbi:Pollen Ole e 1 allergen/extensin [Corchorus capsularis]|uniref:Pollen Ole e 1 allergen/extensin n=1 Tax=Corchorus capsularis TaxID=210143 RepID=A0A1R3HX10_COCAP|nr:Pollen Ole e 1 allergen/extensin [Corchorus capsularis]